MRKWKVEQVFHWAVDVMAFSKDDAQLLPWRGRFLADATAEQVPEALAPHAAAKLVSVLDSKDWNQGKSCAKPRGLIPLSLGCHNVASSSLPDLRQAPCQCCLMLSRLQVILSFVASHTFVDNGRDCVPAALHKCQKLARWFALQMDVVKACGSIA